MITKTTRRAPVTAASRRISTPADRRIIAPTRKAPVTAGIRNKQNIMSAKSLNRFDGLTPEQAAFARQLQANMRKSNASVMAATNTTNIMAKPDFLELLPMFVQKLLILDVYGSVAMNSRQQLIPYFKFVAENTKGETNRGDILSSPFANRQGADPNFTGRVIKNELVSDAAAAGNTVLAYTPVLPCSITLQLVDNGTTKIITDDGAGNLVEADGTTAAGYIDYSTGVIDGVTGGELKATYQYDNENVGPRTPDNGGYGYEYGAQMAKGYLQLDEINLVAEAHQLACYWSIYSAFAAQNEYGANIGDMAKEAAFSEITAEINTLGFQKLREAARLKPQFNWDASPVLTGSVVPSDYLNMFKLKLNQAAASTYQATRLSKPNRLVVGSNVSSYISMINGFNAEDPGETVGPFKLGTLDQFEVYVDPSYDPDIWVMTCKSADIRRNSALFGEYMPLTDTDPITLANSSVQSGYASMFAMKIVNPDSIVSGKLLGTY